MAKSQIVDTESFINAALKVHGDQYDYSRVVYVNSHTKVEIICPQHGSFLQLPGNHVHGANGCPYCIKVPKMTTETFLIKARSKHGNKYDYSKVVCTSANNVVTIGCRIHGDFKQRVHCHLHNGGCVMCKATEKLRRNGRVAYSTSVAYSKYKYAQGFKRIYHVWCNLLQRVTPDSRYCQRFPTYLGCTLATEWEQFDNFYDWYVANGGLEHPEYVLDKDILYQGNKLYSPETCCLIPEELNLLIVAPSQDKLGNCPLGVYYVKKERKYKAQICHGKQRISLGLFHTPEAAFEAYRDAKIKRICQLAMYHFTAGNISQAVYDALVHRHISPTNNNNINDSSRMAQQ